MPVPSALKVVFFEFDGYPETPRQAHPADVAPGLHRLIADLNQVGILIASGAIGRNARPVAVAAEPHECIVIGNTSADITAALDGGFVTVGIGASETLQHAHHTVRNLEDLDAAQLVALHAAYRSDRWRVVREGAAPEREGACGTLFCVGNGCLGVRGSLPGAGQGFYVAGLYDRVDRGPQKPETWSPFLKYWGNADLARESQIEVCLINCPDFLKLSLAVDGCPVLLDPARVRNVKRVLDLHSAVYTVEVECGTVEGRNLRLTHRRFADAVNPQRVFSQYTVEPLNFSGVLRIAAAVDGSTTSSVAYGRQRTYDVTGVDAVASNAAVVDIRGRTDGMEASFSLSLTPVDRPHAVCLVETRPTGAHLSVDVEVMQDTPFYFEQVLVVATGRLDPQFKAAVRRDIVQAAGTPFGEARIATGRIWNEYWESSDVRIEGNVADQLGTRFSIYHLLLSASCTDAGVSIPAKGLSGEMYRGMVFWDTDVHMTPFFNLTQPAMARNLAMFRCRTLAGARRKATAYGFRGASYPWETGVSGDEECEKWLKLITHQSHITSDVALALQRYVDCTGDEGFLEDFAAEVLIDTARFWLSKVRPNPDGSCSIPAAGGPDEFHVVCDDSAYVCSLAAHNLQLAAAAVRRLQATAPAKLAAILQRCGATGDESPRFLDVASRLRTMRRDDGLFEQCAGFFGLRDEVSDAHGGERPFETQCVKQADVIMMMYLLPDRWSPDDLRVNYAYYEPRTIHASSLSHAVHGIVAARLGLTDVADRYIRRSLGMDLNDEMGNADLGAHMAADGMNWLAIVEGYGGCRPRGHVFLIEAPQLPKDWNRLSFRLKWRGADFEVEITHQTVTVRNAAHAQPLPLNLCGKRLDLAPGQECRTGGA